jgi:hypothetical protein
MMTEVSVDVGPNAKELIERLAQQIGATADQVFPWYVQQQIIEGWTTLVVLGIFLVVSIVAFSMSLRKADWSEGNAASVLSILSGLLLAFSVAGVPLEGVDAVRQVLNPKYYAVKVILQQVKK